jgi:hypothetical protein
MDQPGPGSASRCRVADLESPLPDVGFAGGGNAVFDAFVDHELPRAAAISTRRQLFCDARNPGDYGKAGFVNSATQPSTRQANRAHRDIITKFAKAM